MGLIAEKRVTLNKLSIAVRVPQLRIEIRRLGGQLIRSLKNHYFVNVSGIPFVVLTTLQQDEARGALATID
jgi:hypothetical protein